MSADPSTRVINLADLFEVVAGAAPDRLAIVCGDSRSTYGDLDRRANRVAHALTAAGVGTGDVVGIHARNRIEWIESMIGALKLRATPINVNFRYVAAELAHVYASAGLRALVVEREYAAVAAAAARDVPSLTAFLVLEDGSDAAVPDGFAPFEPALAVVDDVNDFAPRSPDDPFVLFTGGTTGLPKGVVWRSEDIFRAAMEHGGPEARLRDPAQLVERAANPPLVMGLLAPLMHGAAQWSLWISLTTAGTYVLWHGRTFDAPEIWRLLARERVQMVGLVGDAMARPLADALPHMTDCDLSALVGIASGGAALSPAVREALVAAKPGLVIIDGYGASETGYHGTGTGAVDGETGPLFHVGGDTAVLDDDLKPVVPGSEQVGKVARTGHIPLRYLGDPDKTAEVFRTDASGTRWVVPGDLATVGADGQIHLLGRGSTVINTGGEKVYPSEVEGAVKHHPAVLDVLVVGVPDARFGARVAAVVALRDRQSATDAELDAVTRENVAGYKVPRLWVRVPEVRRTPAGKPDYRWAAAQAAAAQEVSA
ncbi:MAG TPA: AMP-binding protein [Mycobacteriales bacterium]|nr:AMP-binding protein [Mycobacteriales bacterium]